MEYVIMSMVNEEEVIEDVKVMRVHTNLNIFSLVIRKLG